MTKKVYLAGPITGNGKYKELFRTWEERVRAGCHYDIVNPLYHPKYSGPDVGTLRWRHYMRESVRELIDCNIILMLPGWEASRGATLELYLARQLGIQVFYGIEHAIERPEEEARFSQETDRFSIINADGQGGTTVTSADTPPSGS